MPEFIPGLELCRRFYWEIIRPLLDQHFPDLPHAACRIGPGSEVLGFDTQMSMDHHWFPSVLIFLDEENKHLGTEIHEMLRWQLPPVFKGFPTNLAPIPGEPGTYIMELKSIPPINHGIQLSTAQEFFSSQLGWSDFENIQPSDWLSTPTQLLRTLTSGAVYYDNVGNLTEIRSHLTWYPTDVWLYLLAAGWHRIDDSEHLMPRAGYVGDELGSAVIGASLVRDIMSLGFLIEKQYAPYPKWFGTAFQHLECAGDLSPVLQQVLLAETWQTREAALAAAYHQLAHMHNQSGITGKLPEEVSSFHERPFKVIHGDQFAEAILDQIQDPQVQEIARRTLAGGVDQISDNTKFLTESLSRESIRKLYAG